MLKWLTRLVMRQREIVLEGGSGNSDLEGRNALSPE